MRMFKFTKFFVLLFLCCCCVVFGAGPRKSPHNEAMNILQAAGCTNRLVAHTVIDAVKKGLSNTVLLERLSGTSSITASRLTAWFTAVTTYNAALARGQ